MGRPASRSGRPPPVGGDGSERLKVRSSEGTSVYRAVKAVLVREGKILLVRFAAEYEFLGGEWEIPGGRKRVGESDMAALKREVLEEVGLSVKSAKPVASWRWEDPSRGFGLDGVTYLCAAVGEVSLANDAEKQHDAFRWVTPAEAETYNVPP